MTEELVFGREEAREYEAWFETREGRRVDRLEKTLLRNLLMDLQGPQPGTMLEVACGTGHFSRYFNHELKWAVNGVDISRPMLEEARSRDTSFAFALADATALPFPDQSYDVVTIITALEFMSEPAIALHEAIRVARRGILIGALNRWSLLAMWRRVAALFEATPYDSAHFLSSGELRRMVEGLSPHPRIAIDARTAVWPGLLSFLQTSTCPLGAFLAMRLRFDPPAL